MWNAKFSVFDDVDELTYGTGFEGTVTEKHLEEYYSQRPDVCLERIDLLFEDLGCHINGRSEHRLGHVDLEHLAETKIT